MKDAPQVASEVSLRKAKGLLRGYREILVELSQLGICKTKDSPIGGYGEWLVARAFGGQRQCNSMKSFDVLTSEGSRLQVKTRWLAVDGDSRQLGAIRNLSTKGFDYLVGVLLNRDFGVAEAYQLPYELVVRLVRPMPHINAKRLVLNPRVCSSEGCVNITEKLRRADPDLVE